MQVQLARLKPAATGGVRSIVACVAATALATTRGEVAILEVVGWAPVGWRKGDVPEIWGGGFELDGRVKTFGHGLRAADDLAGNAIFGSGVFQHQMRLNGETLFQDQQGSIVANADGSGVEGYGFSLQRDMDIGAHAQEDALAAAAFVAGDGCGGNRLRRGEWLCRGKRFRGACRRAYRAYRIGGMFRRHGRGCSG